MVTIGSLFESAICVKIRSRNKVLQTLAGSTLGADDETFLASYKRDRLVCGELWGSYEIRQRLCYGVEKYSVLPERRC